MQFYVVTCVVPSETQDDGYTAFIKYMEDGAEMDNFDELEVYILGDFNYDILEK